MKRIAVHLFSLFIFSAMANAESISHVHYPSNFYRGQEIQISFYLDNSDTSRVPECAFVNLKESDGTRVISSSIEANSYKSYYSMKMIIPMDCPVTDDLYFQVGVIQASGSNQAVDTGDVECYESPFYIFLILVGFVVTLIIVSGIRYGGASS